ncbi:type II toxin-antitoxin system RelE/ParE family toxin [Candidatus Omnitrophota bacterium]
MYSVVYLDQVERDLKKLDKPLIKKIIDKIENYLTQDPHGLGKPLTGSFRGYWRYRWGDYRVIYRISEQEILIVVLRISHRKIVYGDN